jgi:hypothetical protein
MLKDPFMNNLVQAIVSYANERPVNEVKIVECLLDMYNEGVLNTRIEFQKRMNLIFEDTNSLLKDYLKNQKVNKS